MSEVEIQEKGKSSVVMKEVMSWVKVLTLALCIAILFTFFIRSSVVSGDSMNPTFHNRDYLLLNRAVYNIHPPARTDVVVFKSKMLNEVLIKRVIGEAGDLVEIKDGKVFINEKELIESYLPNVETFGTIKEVIPEGKVFVLGDNRGNSMDSRFQQVGLVDVKDIIGKVMIRLYPLKTF
jgi:signal peptidase I